MITITNKVAAGIRAAAATVRAVIKYGRTQKEAARVLRGPTKADVKRQTDLALRLLVRHLEIGYSINEIEKMLDSKTGKAAE